jgi:protoporphyrinogen/coproporphyrinogen III oxidase
MNTAHARPHVVVVGGGITGLAAAWHLRDVADCTVVEASARWGGKVYTERFDGYAVEWGPDSLITRKPWALDLIHELGLDDCLIEVNDLPERIYVLNGGELHPLPDGLHLLVPTKIAPFLRSPLFSPLGKLRMLAEALIPPKTDDTDETLAQFITRRMGREALDRLAEPMLGGVYNSEVEKQSILATFPNFRALERKHGSLIRGMRRMQATRAGKTPALPPILSLHEGMGSLVEALVAKLTCDLRLDATVTGIDASDTGYTVKLWDGETIQADAVILTTPAFVTARLLNNLAPVASARLNDIRYAGVGSASLAFDRADIPQALDAYGVVIPSREGRRIDGMQWASSKWMNRAPSGKALLRVFFGGPHTRDMIDKTDEQLIEIIRAELRDLLGITAEPLTYSISRWESAYPQYDLNHLERVAQIEAALPQGVYVAGSPYRGVGLPDCIKQAQATATLIEQRNTELQSSRETKKHTYGQID